ncbi:GAF domain-containing protein [Pseudonocardia sp. KRD-184]|uniref:GAF domain-containing protein n=1 Tax=Pseudonocardia oceani TaxID=2792013 RepID=A0ABS6U228_9PSEU|nr:helix-turn-helix domain-containing protein [Pseudonocardia oceani]MBW0089987.1 GAF domain-containing protein [Pseudonocardia oceani]MBW0094862.1 GAF domain-containing protein [Pseudonocardia oceani]MBW0108180.1 GAF domain-containing protein [Pseudonocardia oceani]MBW0120561.1 GAF domain-containing protein [Pseudonocardia oceani]MBW0126285.1 GAF domain-containing protein [Pseudonocardia oceani]
MTILQHAVAHQREAFLEGRTPSTMRPEIAVSWRRCSYLDVPVDTMTPRYAPDFDHEAPLVRAARPVLDHVNERLGDLGISFLLTDASARILNRTSSNTNLLRRLDAVSAAEGFVFAEGDVGTNGVGTALELGRTVRVDGHEHYAEDLHEFTCVGAPIRSVDRRLHGLLDVTCAADHHNSLVEYIAEQTAEQIEQRLWAQQSGAERALLDRFVAASRRVRHDFFVISERLLISSPRAAQLLDGAEQALVWEQVTRLLRSPDASEAEVELADGRMVVMHGESMSDGGDEIGAIVEIREAPRAESGPTGGGRTPAVGLPGLVGTDPAWLRACLEIAARARERVVVVSGEPGVGKTAVAEAVHRHLGGDGPLVVRDAESMTVDGPSAWMSSLRSVLVGEPGTVVVRHVDGVSPAALRTVTSLLHGARGQGWHCLATAGTQHLPMTAGHEDQRCAAVALPPLRNRTNDIPALVRSFAAPRRLAPEVISLLMRTPWPGNTRDLRSAIDQALTVTRGSEVHLGDLPDDLRARAYRRRMSRFEQAELSAIMDAMSEAAGNKKAAAALLGISRSTLYRKLEAAGIGLS